MTSKQKPPVDFTRRAEAAESRGDFARAGMWWNYAAQAVAGNPRNLRTVYHQREDAAKEKAREHRV